MPRIKYLNYNFGEAGLDAIDRTNKVLQTFASQGFYDATLRQIYYKFVAFDYFPDDRKFTWTGSKWVRDPNGTKNAEPNYKWLGVIIANARCAGLIDWNAIIDRTRKISYPPMWDSPKQLVESASNWYDVDRWDNQETRVEVWVEKDAMVGVVAAACQPWYCPYFSCRGYASDTEIWSSARRFEEIAERGQRVLILHLGDHDPSGIDMTRDLDSRLHLYSGLDDERLEIRRIALTMEQIREINPPPNPAKMTDKRAKKYVQQYGNESWELDALDPPYVSSLIATHIQPLIATSKWKAMIRVRDRGRKELVDVSNTMKGDSDD